jgi:23S rRNA pseudouridine1911/1915/1917 synthase
MTMQGSETPAPTRIPVSEERAGLRAEEFLALELPHLSRARIRQKIMTGESLLNGGRYATSARLKAGDEITVFWRAKPKDVPAPPLPVLFEDEHILAVDKPAGICVHPAGRIQSGTLIQFVRQRHAPEVAESLAKGDSRFYPRLIHRLDRFTSGIVLVAKHTEALERMRALAAGGGMRKRYTAVVEGTVEPREGRLEMPLARAEGSKVEIRMEVSAGGLPCVTEYRVLRRLAGHTLLHAFPLTGRQHQIRVHFAVLGHPVWGDLIYKDERLFLRYWKNGCVLDDSLPPRHLLHADCVSFTHPFAGKEVEISSNLPEDFVKILEGLQ